MKKLTAMLLALILALTCVTALAENDLQLALDMLLNSKTAWNFNGDEVPEADINTILQAGVNTASAINESPWTFTVITNADIIAQLADTPATKAAKLMILISVPSSNEMKILDAGLACQSMQIAANLLGYATKIETGPARIVRNDQTGEWAKTLGIPEGKLSRAALFIGHGDTDATTSASVRLTVDGVVTWVK